MSGIDIASSAATAAENNPVYNSCVILKRMGDGAKTHKCKHSLGIVFPSFHHFLVHFLGHFEIHGEK